MEEQVPDFREFLQSRLEGELSLKNVPALLHIKNGSVSKTYTNWADIRNTLADAMQDK